MQWYRGQSSQGHFVTELMLDKIIIHEDDFLFNMNLPKHSARNSSNTAPGDESFVVAIGVLVVDDAVDADGVVVGGVLVVVVGTVVRGSIGDQRKRTKIQSLVCIYIKLYL